MLTLLVINSVLLGLTAFLTFLNLRICMVVNDKVDLLKSSVTKNTESNFKYVEAVKRSME